MAKSGLMKSGSNLPHQLISGDGFVVKSEKRPNCTYFATILVSICQCSMCSRNYLTLDSRFVVPLLTLPLQYSGFVITLSAS